MAIITAQAPLPTSPVDLTGTPSKQAPIQPATSEAPATEAPKQDALSPKFAALGRKERQLRAQAQQIKQREDALKAKEAQFAPDQYVSKADLQKRFQENPFSAMEYGLTHDQIAQMALNAPGPESQEIQKLKARIEELSGKQTEIVTKQEAQQQQAYDQAVNQIRQDTKLLIETDSNFETIKETNASEAVVELIKETFDNTGQLLSVEDAAKEVENYLLEEALRMAKLKKVAAKLGEVVQPVQPPPTQKTQITQKPQQLRTLTNTVSVSSAPLTEKDRIQRAVLAFKGQLK